MSGTKIDLITVLGPTATGKTQFAVSLASLLQSEIISADSRQVYKGMDLGTGKDLAEYDHNGKQIPFHLIDIVDAGARYNVFEYQADFLKVYNALTTKNILPVLCGGSGMYIESVLKGYKLISVPVNEPLRQQLESLSMPKLLTMLSTYKNLHNTSDADTKKRAIRAIEIAEYYQTNHVVDTTFPKLQSLIFGLNLDREIVKQRITLRLKQRLRDGMIDEVEMLIKQGVPLETLIYYGLEYKYIAMYLNKEYSYNQMVERLNVAIHQFAKRQMTWFRKMERDGFKIHWIDGMLSNEEKVANAIRQVSLEGSK